MKTNHLHKLIGAVVVALLAGGCAPAEAPAPSSAPTPKPAPKVTAVALAVPILEGKADALKAFIEQVKGERAEEWNQARVAAGLTREVVWHQAGPGGGFAVVYQEGPDLATRMQKLMASEAAIDKDFIAMLTDVHGMDPSQPLPMGRLSVDYQGEGGPNPPYGFAVPVLEGQEAVATEFLAANAGEDAEAFAASRARTGITRERVWSYDGGKLLVVVWESADDAATVLKNWQASDEEFDSEFLEAVEEFTGIDYAADAPPPNTLLLDWSASTP